jgi:WD40 repeat protein
MILLWKMSPDGDVRLASDALLPRTDNIAFHPNSKMLVATGNNDGHLFGIGPKGFERLPTTFPGANSSLTFAADNSMFACVVFNPARNGNLYGSEAKVWTIADNKFEEQHLIQQDRFIKALALSPDKKTLATAALDLKVRLWDLAAKPPTVKADFARPSWLKSLDFTSNGAFLLAVGSASDIALWNVRDARIEKSWRFMPKRSGAGGGPFSASTLAPDERHVAVSTFNNPVTFILRLPTGK